MYSPLSENIRAIAERRVNERFLPEAALPGALEATDDPARAFDGAGIILHTTPTQFIRTHWAALAGHCPSGVPICSVSKGVENRNAAAADAGAG